MKAFEIKRLMLVALVACLPIACGSSSPTGPDTAVDNDFTASALRSAPGLPPNAPEAPSPDPVPVPEPSDPKDDGNSVPTILPEDDDAGSIPAPDNTGGRPSPNPSDDPTSEPVPADGTTPEPQPDSGAIPAPQPDDSGSIPAPPVRPVPAPNVPPAIVPPPPQADPNGDDSTECLAVAAEIMILRGSLPAPLHGASVLLELLMLNKEGNPIKDGSCQGVAWSFEAAGFTPDAAITVGADTRFAAVDGPAGAYGILAVTPNGQTARVTITLE